MEHLMLHASSTHDMYSFMLHQHMTPTTPAIRDLNLNFKQLNTAMYTKHHNLSPLMLIVHARQTCVVQHWGRVRL